MTLETAKSFSDVEKVGRFILVTGGCRSGKSEFAERLLSTATAQLFYIATALVCDSGMKQRVQAHKERRGESWTTLEAPEDPSRVLRELGTLRNDVGGVLLDCITLWLSNCMLREMSDAEIFRQVRLLAENACMLSATKRCPVVFVTNEVGCGIVPGTEIGSRFRDLAGLINQELARYADDVALVVCGLPIFLKGNCLSSF